MYAHLSNHCINTRSDTYGEYEATHEMFYAEFEALLDGARGAGALRARVLPQVDAIVAHCFDAARESVEVRWRGTYGYVSGHRSFQLFGFDFMVTEALEVKLIEINSSPAVAVEVLPQCARDLTARAIDAALEPGDAPPAPLALGAKRDGFTLVVPRAAVRRRGRGDRRAATGRGSRGERARGRVAPARRDARRRRALLLVSGPGARACGVCVRGLWRPPPPPLPPVATPALAAAMSSQAARATRERRRGAFVAEYDAVRAGLPVRAGRLKKLPLLVRQSLRRLRTRTRNSDGAFTQPVRSLCAGLFLSL